MTEDCDRLQQEVEELEENVERCEKAVKRLQNFEVSVSPARLALLPDLIQ